MHSTSRGRGWVTFRRLSVAARSSEIFAENTHFSGLILAVCDVKSALRVFQAPDARTRVRDYVDRPPYRPRHAAVCRGLTAHRPPWPTVIVHWLERVRQRRNMHMAALSSVLRVSARAKPRTEWLGGRVRAGRGGRMKVSRCVRSGSFRAHLRWLSGCRARVSRLGHLAARGCSSEAPSTTPVTSAPFSDPTCETASTKATRGEKATRGASENTCLGLSDACLVDVSRGRTARRGGSQERI